MTDINLYHAKCSSNRVDEWVIVETCSHYYLDEADTYIYEKNKTSPNKSIDRGFRIASGDFVVFLANDVTVCSKWIEYLLECFEKEDCGIASLGNNEHKDVESFRIVEDLYFSVCMVRKEDAWFDPYYNKIFDDTDLCFRLHLQGKKFYKNLKGIVKHKPHSTYGKYCGDQEEYIRSKEYFAKKYIQYKDDPLYKKFVNG